jgi:glycosyltransferase involved in cell wall biosynthesis
MTARPNRIAALLYSHYFPPSVGGVEVYASALAERLAAAPDLELTVVTGTAGDAEAGGRARSYALHRRPSAVQLLGLLRRCDVVLMMGMQPQLAAAARVARVPVIWAHMNHDTICPKTTGYRWQDDTVCSYQPIQCWSCLRADHTPGQALRNIASLHVRRALFGGATHVSPAQIVRSRLLRPIGEVIPTAHEADLFRPLPGVERDLDRVLFVARLIPEKGAHLFVRALARARREGAPNLHATIYGDGPERERLSVLAREEQIEEQVSFAGAARRADLPREIAASLAVVNPQLWDWVLGISALDVLACGRPLISTRPADTTELPPEVALLFERGDVAGFARALVQVRTDAALRAQLEAEGPAFVQKFHDLDRATGSYLALIRAAATSAARRG